MAKSAPIRRFSALTFFGWSSRVAVRVLADLATSLILTATRQSARPTPRSSDDSYSCLCATRRDQLDSSVQAWTFATRAQADAMAEQGYKGRSLTRLCLLRSIISARKCRDLHRDIQRVRPAFHPR